MKSGATAGETALTFGMLPESNRNPAREAETLADLEGLIAKQMQNLPAWWDDETYGPREEKAPRPEVAPLVMRQILTRRYCGRAVRVSRA